MSESRASGETGQSISRWPQPENWPDVGAKARAVGQVPGCLLQRWSRAGRSLCLTPSALMESHSADRMLKGLKCHQNPSPIGHSTYPIWPADPKETDFTCKETMRGTVGKLASTFEENQGWNFSLIGWPDKNWAHAPRVFIEWTIPQPRWESEAATTECSVLFPMLVSPREGLGLPNCTPAAGWRSSFYPLSHDTVKGIISTQHLKPEFPVTSDDRISLACIRFTLFRYCIKETLFLRNQKNKLSLWAGDDFNKQLYLWTRRALVFSMSLPLNLSVPGLLQLARNSDGLCWQPLAL